MSRGSVGRPGLAILLVALLASACTTGTPGATAARTPSAAASLSPSSAEPPPASLAAEGGDPVTGQLGSFTWGDGGSDSPWLPGARLTVGHAEPLTVSIAGGVAVAEWSVRRVPGGTTDGSGAVALGSGTGPIAFIAPGPGSWSVQVTVGFGGDLGTASYYWQLTVR